jgi:hypothetical protein
MAHPISIFSSTIGLPCIAHRWVLATLIISQVAFAERPAGPHHPDQVAAIKKVHGDVSPATVNVLLKQRESDLEDTLRPDEIEDRDEEERHRLFPWTQAEGSLKYRVDEGIEPSTSQSEGMHYGNLEKVVANMTANIGDVMGKVETHLEEKAKDAVAKAHVVDKLAEQEVDEMNNMTKNRVSFNNKAREQKLKEVERLRDYMRDHAPSYNQISYAALKRLMKDDTEAMEDLEDSGEDEIEGSESDSETDSSSDGLRLSTKDAQAQIQKLLDVRFPKNRVKHDGRYTTRL